MDLLSGLILVILWLSFALISGVVASSLGRSRIGWFVLGLVFGPLSFLALGAMANMRPGKDELPPPRDAEDAEQRWPR
jgi:hypothetical protein